MIRLPKLNRIAIVALAAACGASSGCMSISRKYPTVVPANRLEKDFMYETKATKADVPFAALGQDKPISHKVGAGDTLTVFVYGVFPPNVEDVPIIQRNQSVNQRYYPPNGNLETPAVGVPVVVDADGAIALPLIGNLGVDGMTVTEIIEAIREAYSKQGILEPGRERIMVNMIIPRVHRVVVMRQDTPNPQVALVPPGQVDHIHRGSGDVIDLPVYENDVLHALAATGGLPGTDAANEVWVIRRKAVSNGLIGLEQLSDLTSSYDPKACDPNIIRIPLRVNAGCASTFSPEDVILNEGDVVYLPRRVEYFYTGGLLRGAKIPLPRDEDIDALEAVALANGSVQGPLGQGGQMLATGSPGYIIKPTKLIVLRKLPGGEQLPIEVDLCRAAKDPRERVYIQHGDMLLLKFRPHEAVLNGTLNFFTPSILFTGN
jgi:protein involved in polysaccharide export with SLBB domain